MRDWLADMPVRMKGREQEVAGTAFSLRCRPDPCESGGGGGGEGRPGAGPPTAAAPFQARFVQGSVEGGPRATGVLQEESRVLHGLSPSLPRPPGSVTGWE